MIDSDLTIRNISMHHNVYYNMKRYRDLYLSGLSEATDYPEDICQISIGSNTIYGIYRNMIIESTFPVRICCLCWDNDRKRERIFRHGD